MPIRFAILTAGNIAGQMAETVSHMPEICRWAVAARDPDITEESGEGYTLYTQETEGDYGVVVRDGTNILYVYCPQYDTTWMKWFLYELGYLSTF